MNLNRGLAMTRKLFYLLASVLCVVVVVVYYEVSPPYIYDAEGNSEWNQEMDVMSKVGIWPAYKTDIGSARRTGGLISNGEVIQESNYVTFALWNGYGIKKLSFMEKRDGVWADYLYAPSYSQIDNSNAKFFWVTILIPQNEWDGLKVTVTDKFGNVTTGILSIPPA